MSLFAPDRYFSRLSCVNIELDVISCGFKAVLLDVDNTVLTRDTRTVPSDIASWLNEAQARGVALCFLSNNFHQDVVLMAKELKIPIVSKALKPLPFGYMRACNVLKCARKHAVMIGDQLSTDIAGAHAIGMKAYMVCPLVQEELKHTKVLRNFEQLFLKDQNPEGVSYFE